MLGGGMFMGQMSVNRLDQVSIPAIIGRIQIAPVMQQYVDKVNQENAALGAIWAPRPHPTPLPTFPPMTEAEKQILFEISKNPTDEELKDLATIDSLFSQNFQTDYLTTNEACYWVENRYPLPRVGRGAAVIPVEGASSAEFKFSIYLNPLPLQPTFSRFGNKKPPPPPDTSFVDNKFWCTDPSTIEPELFLDHVRQLGKFGSFAQMFGIDVNKTWGQIKLQTTNGLIVLKVKSSYPLPPPLDMAPDYVWNLAAVPHLPEMVNLGVVVDPEAFRSWYTMAVLEKYNDAADHIIAEQKRKARRAKRKAILKAVGFAIAGVVLSFIVPAIIAAAVAAIKAAVDIYIQAKQRAEAAKAMAEAAKMFEEDAPAFAAEVQKTADMMDYAAAQEEANAPLTQEQLDAIQEVRDNPEPGDAPSTGQILVTGGTAAGIIAAMVAIFNR